MSGRLKNGNQQHTLTVEEARKGGINSGKARKEKATMKKMLEMLLDETNEVSNKTYRELATFGLIRGAINGNAQNYKTIVEVLGELKDEEKKEVPTLNISIVNNEDLESVMYEDND